MIKVLIVDDSPIARELLAYILGADAGIQVIGKAATGREAVDFLTHNTPDLITMDIHMPGWNGYETTRTIMETRPTPIVMVTASANMRDLETSFKAIEAGALTVLQKPRGIGHPDYKKDAGNLITTVKLMAEIKVVRRWARPAVRMTAPRRDTEYDIAPRSAEIKIVAMGTSTGGPPIIEKILSALPHDFTPPILIVQHMAEGFIRGYAEWLGQTSALPVHVAYHGGITRPGHVYIAPDTTHMGVDTSGRISCIAGPAENGLRPSVSYLFRSIAEIFGKNAVGVLLTGMGKDGAQELKLMRDKGAVTIVQDEESSAVFGMPGEAIKLGAARYVMPADKIAAVLSCLTLSKIQRTDPRTSRKII